MIRSKIIVAAAVFFTILLSSAGCYSPSFERTLNRHETADAQAVNTDGGATTTTHNIHPEHSDQHLPQIAPSDVVHRPSYREPFAILTDEKETPSGVLALPYEIRQAFAHNMEVWLLNYEAESTSPAVMENLTILLPYPRDHWELVSSSSRVGRIRAFIALPEGWTPLFNVRVTSLLGEHRLALDGRDDFFPRLRGALQIWAIHPGGSYHPAQPVFACHDTHASEDQPAGLVPGGACPEIVDSCPVLYELTCRHL